MLGPGERESLEELDWAGHADDLVGIRPAIEAHEPGKETRWRLKRRDGACIYLGDNHQCRIQEHFGPEKKPLVCRLYPFGFYPMGDRIGVDVSFTCRAVAEGLGAGIAERVPAWTRLLDESSDAGAVDKSRHRLTESVPISGALVWTFEHYLLGFLSDESLDLFARIRCTLQFMRLATTGDPTTPTAATLREAMAKGIPIQIAREPATAEMDKTQRAIFFQWLYLCLNPPPYDFHDWPRQAQEHERHRRIRTGRRYLKETGTATIDNRELSVTFQEIARVQGDIFPHRELTSPLEDFLKVKILGQKFLVQAEAELPLVEAVPRFLLTVPMTLWTAKALAADQGRRRVESVDVRNALRLVDRTLGTLSTSALPTKQAEACDFVMLETDLVEAAICDLVLAKD